MRKLFLLCTVIAALSVCLMIAAILHLSFLNGSAKEYVEVLESQFVNQTSLSIEQAQALKRIRIRLGGGEAYISNLHSRLWWFSVSGFGLVSLLSSVAAVLAWKANKRARTECLPITATA
jgi:hypothetical protein